MVAVSALVESAEVGAAGVWPIPVFDAFEKEGEVGNAAVPARREKGVAALSDQ